LSVSKLEFQPLTPELVKACSEFNERLRRAGFVGMFDCTPNRDRGACPPAAKEVDRFVGVDADGFVRGAYLLRWQSLWLRGEQLRGASYGYPISEGVVDRQYAMVGVSVLRDALRRCEYLYVLGGGGRSGNVFHIAQHAGWEMEDVPFLFRVLKGGRFIRGLPQMQSGLQRRAFANICDATGLASLAAALFHRGSASSHGGSSSLRQASNVRVDEVQTLRGVADEVWARVSSQYAFCTIRDGAHVEPTFPLDRPDLCRLVVRCDKAIVGWAVVMTEGLSRLRSYLGDVEPGLIVDAFGDTADAIAIARAAASYLADRGVDAVITNTSHDSWLRAYRSLGFLSWRSQFPLIVSKSLARRVGHLAAIMPQAHVSRGDGDGVYYLH
jgi:hypothetical protein